MSNDTRSITFLGLVTLGVILATVIKIEQIINLFTFISPLLMILILICVAVGVAKSKESMAIMKKKIAKGEVLSKEDKIKPGFKPATYNVLNALHLSIVLLFAAYGYFLNAFFWLVIAIAANVAWAAHEKLYTLYEDCCRKYPRKEEEGDE